MTEDEILDATASLLSGKPKAYKQGVIDLAAVLIHPHMARWNARPLIESRIRGRAWIKGGE